MGAFPNPARPRVLWAGLTAADLSPLFELQKAIVNRVTDAGYRPDDQRFTPHVTLGRIRSDRRGQGPLDLTTILQPYLTWSAGTFRVGEVITLPPHSHPKAPRMPSSLGLRFPEKIPQHHLDHNRELMLR